MQTCTNMQTCNILFLEKGYKKTKNKTKHNVYIFIKNKIKIKLKNIYFHMASSKCLNIKQQMQNKSTCLCIFQC